MGNFIEDGVYSSIVAQRHRRGNIMRMLYLASLLFAILALVALLYNIVNEAIGLVAITYTVQPEEVSDRPLEELNAEELAAILLANQPRQLLVTVRDELNAVATDQFTKTPLSLAINGQVPDGLGEKLITEIQPEDMAQILALNLSADRLLQIVDQRVLVETIAKSWTLVDSLFNRAGIESEVEDNYPLADLQWRSWVNADFVSSPLSATAGFTGILPSLLGSVWLLTLTAMVAFPLGVGAAIYLEEYASDSWLNKIIEINIRNLAGVPSIIYGMLGLAIFVRVLVPLTSGACVGSLEGYFTLQPLLSGQCFDGNYLQGATGRTIISGALTLALLILPIIIVNAQEALRAVPTSIREASYGLGATKWQTISRQVLPAAVPGILTGTILAMSRAVGETAPLVVIGAATFITVNPNGPFSRFSALPNVIYFWTSQPDDQFRNAAAAAIIVLLLVLLTMNSAAIILRNRASNRRMS